MPRTTNEKVLLLQCVQIATLVGLLLDLGLPWEHSTDAASQRFRVLTAWSWSDAGPAVMIVMVLFAGALMAHSRWPHIVVGVLGFIAAAGTAFGALSLQNAEVGRALAGLWNAVVLLIVLTVASWGIARLLSDARRRLQADPAPQ